jgi:L-alanine-DL-glutamate epimerase-like enolase superfamily enzyme
MSLNLSYCPFRLRFKHPFGTAHGLRDGTDAVFIRAEQEGGMGYGEVTLPPYLSEKMPQVLEQLRTFKVPPGRSAAELLGQLDHLVDLRHHPGLRAGLHCALIDLLSRLAGQSARAFLGIKGDRSPLTLVTLGIGPVETLREKLADLPTSGALKVKLGDPDSVQRLRAITTLDNRMLFMDGNQGASSLDEAVDWIRAVGIGRVLGVEQPFGMDHDPWNLALGEQAEVTVYADESIQDLDALQAKGRQFGGVNLKLMKCGGLDRALAMADEADRCGLKLMLGSMSESSLGCTAMAQLAGRADVVDLDGPWLLANDPFSGITMEDGRLMLPDGSGFGTTLRAQLDFTPIGA